MTWRSAKDMNDVFESLANGLEVRVYHETGKFGWFPICHTDTIGQLVACMKKGNVQIKASPKVIEGEYGMDTAYWDSKNGPSLMSLDEQEKFPSNTRVRVRVRIEEIID